mgnify:CR=1 FL=1
MLRTKKESAKKTATKKKTTRKVEKKEKIISTSKPITIDVIADDDEVLFREPPADGLIDGTDTDDGREDVDAQKKFFSELVAEIKDKKEGGLVRDTSETAGVDDYKKSRPHKSLNLYRRIALQFTALTVVLLLAVAYFFFSSLQIIIHPSTEIIADSLSFKVVSAEDNNRQENNETSRSLPGELKSIAINAEKVYEASGEEILGEEVVGEVTLYNNYTKAQALVAKTRLLSADNKLFRLKEAVNIPAGGTVKVAVYADQALEEMAIGASRFTIPGLWLGLQDQIYAVSENDFEYKHQVKRYIKQRDLDQAIIDIKKTLQDKAQAAIADTNNSSQVFAYSLNEDSAVIKVGAKLGEEVAEFTVSAENNLSVAIFPKDQIESLVKAKLSFLLPDDKKLTTYNTEDIVYRLDSLNLEAKSADVTAAFQGNMSLRTDANIIDRRQLVNLNQKQISEYLQNFPEINSYELNFYPSFIKRSPSLADRISIDVK